MEVFPLLQVVVHSQKGLGGAEHATFDTVRIRNKPQERIRARLFRVDDALSIRRLPGALRDLHAGSKI
jgi:hypothetical protein